MKKVLFILLLCLFIFVSCQSTEVEPPSMTASNYYDSVNAWRGGYSWTYLQLGKVVSTAADAVSPLDAKEELPVIRIIHDTRSSVNPGQINLTFTSHPNSVSVKIYDYETGEDMGYASVGEYEDGGKRYAFAAHDGKSIYEVIGVWDIKGNESKVTYSFVTSLPDFEFPCYTDVDIID